MPDNDELSWREEVLQRHAGHALVYWTTLDCEQSIQIEDGLVVRFIGQRSESTFQSAISCRDCGEELIAESEGDLIELRVEP